MADIKWSAFPTTAAGAASGDILVGLHSADNYQFTLSPSAVALAVMQRDANNNASANNFLEGYATTATAAGTTTLTVASAYFQFFTGSTTQTVVMPVASTLTLGQSWMIVNNSSDSVTVNSSGGNAIQVMAANSSLLVTCILTSGTTAASWNASYAIDSSSLVTSITGTANQVLANGITGTPQVGAITVTLPQDIATTSSPSFTAVTAGNITIDNDNISLPTGSLVIEAEEQDIGSIILRTNTSDPATIDIEIGPYQAIFDQEVKIGSIRLYTTTINNSSTTDPMYINAGGTSGVQTPIVVGGNNAMSLSQGGPYQFIIDTSSVGYTNIASSISIGTFSGAQAVLPPALNLIKSRAVSASLHVAVANSDSLGSINIKGDDGTNFVTCASITSFVTNSVSTGIVPANLIFSTMNTSGTLTTAMTISNAQVITLANALPIGSGGLGVTTTPSNGQIPIGNGSGYTVATLTQGAGISITNGAGSITIASSTGIGSWIAASTTSITAEVNTGYYITNASQVTITLPTTAAAGSVVAIAGNGAGGWILQPGAGQTIKIQAGSASTSITSAEQYDCIEVICVVANTTWVTRSAVTTGFTVS